ncbi:MAG: hypothetical protein PHT48_12540 [Dechloromonas sp.]|nr:hypothetical protein [Dechloromonas sp.]
MPSAHPIPADPLAALASPETQRLAARMVQDVFAGVFRQGLLAEGAPDVGILGEVAGHCADWCRAASDDEARALRLALLIGGLDQWGLAYTQTFQLTAIHPLTALIGGLRTRLDVRADSLFQRYFEQLAQDEFAAVDFKVALRRSIHLALWHALAASESADEGAAIVQSLGSLMLALEQRLPELGWRLVADALAHIQIALLAAQPPASALAQDGTQQLFASLQHALPAARYQAIVAHAGQAVVAWQQAGRASRH